MKCGVYKIKCTGNGKFYIGSSVNIPKRLTQHFSQLRHGRHENIYLQRVYDKYGEESFVTSVLAETETIGRARRKEQKYLNKFCESSRFINIGNTASGGDNLTHHPKREKIIRKIKRSLRKTIDNMTDAERRKTYCKFGDKNGMYGRTHTPETKAHLSKVCKGKVGEEHHRYGSKHSEGTKRIMSKAAKKRAKEKDYVNSFAGKTHTKETRKKISAANKGKLPPNTRRVVADGKKYVSLSEAARKFDIQPAAMLYRVRSDSEKFSSYYYLD